MLSLPAGEAARLLALRQLEDWAQAQARLDHPPDAEAVHDFRVALRRLRSLLRAFRSPDDPIVPRRLRRRLRGLATATGESRDLEVKRLWIQDQLPGLTPRQRSAVKWMIAGLDARLATANERLRTSVTRRFAPLEGRLRSALAEAAASGDPHLSEESPRAGVLLGRIVLRWTAMLETELEAIRTIADDGQAHAARIAAKRLRYVLEPFTGDLPPVPAVIDRLKELQDLLGDLHDSHRIAAELGDAFRATALERAERTFRETLPWGHIGTDPPLQAPRHSDPRAGLEALSQRLRTRGEELFSRLRSTWLVGGGMGRLGLDLRAIAEQAERLRPQGVEIERKFLLAALPSQAQAFPVQEIEQGWLPGSELVERLRRVRSNGHSTWFRTVKIGQGITRLEIEEATAPELFDALWPLTEGCRVTKRRYVVPEGPLTWEIDEFLDRDLVLAEIELPTEDASFEIPAWLKEYVVREVTGEREYVNRVLAR